jgi:small-conductance mechanosensitive channel
VRAGTLFLAVLVALPIVGIDVTALSIFSGALGVGLGFGLQKIASNYVSGFIVLLDRSLRIGDLITVDNRRGVVQEIASRYTVIKSSDGTESIIPNEKLITESVNHHTFTDPKVAVIVPVQVSYETDMDQALATLLECARAQELVLQEPAPVSRLKAFREDGVDLELVCWIGDVVTGDADVKSGLMRDILRRFAERRIEIPYPRRDVRFLTTLETENSPSAPRT